MSIDATTARHSMPPVRASLGPPGLVFWLVVAAAILLGLDANSRQSFGELLAVVPLWFAVAGWWLLRFGWWAWTVGRRSRIRIWIAWALVPTAMGIVFVLTRFNVPADVRLALSRQGMDQAASEIMAGGSTDRGWIGWYPASDVERLSDGIRFVIDDNGLGRLGFVYSTANDPRPEVDDPLWCCDQFEPIGGGWYIWTQEWD